MERILASDFSFWGWGLYSEFYGVQNFNIFFVLNMFLIIILVTIIFGLRTHFCNRPHDLAFVGFLVRQRCNSSLLTVSINIVYFLYFTSGSLVILVRVGNH